MLTRQVSEGIELKQFERRDAEALFAVVSRNREYLRQWLPWVDQTRSEEDIRQFLSRVTAQCDEGLGPNFGIWHAGTLAGAVGCHPFDRANRSCSLGYWLEAGRQGQGIMTACCRRLVEYVFREAGLHRVQIRCAIGNTRSCAIPQRLGFTHEGVLREAEWVNDRWLDLNMYSMLEREYR